MWFLKPEGWTLFDNLASKSLLTGSDKDQVKRMKRFYTQLDCRCFVEDADQIQKIIRTFSDNKNNLKTLHGARVIDKFLMLVGKSNDKRRIAIDINELFLKAIPSGTAKALKALGKEIADACGDELLKRRTERKKA